MATTTQNEARTAAKAQVLYDGQCALCRKSVEILRSLDWLKKLEYVDVRDASQPLLQHPRIARAPLLEQMHVVPAGSLEGPNPKIYGGFAAARWMAWRLPLFMPLAPFYYLPGVPWLGDRIYKWVARNRFRLVPCHDGVCTIQKDER